MKNKNLLKEAWAHLCEGQSYILACHERPDGDALGSALAVARVLRQQAKEVVVVCDDGVPDNYVFIPDSDSVVTHTDRRDFDVGILVDSEEITRVGTAADAVQCAKVTACIDHHVPDGKFGDKSGEIDPETAARTIGKVCLCGCFNTHAAAKLLS